jgi:hypothetical protein
MYAAAVEKKDVMGTETQANCPAAEHRSAEAHQNDRATGAALDLAYRRIAADL